MGKIAFLSYLFFTIFGQADFAAAASKPAPTASAQSQAMIAKLLLGSSTPSNATPRPGTGPAATSCQAIINSNPQIQQKLQALGTSFVSALAASKNGDVDQIKAAVAGYQANPTSLLQSLSADQMQIVSQIAQMVSTIAPNCQ